MMQAATHPLTERDVDKVHDLAAGWAEEAITYGQVAPAKEAIADNPGSYSLVATEGEELVAFIWG